MIDGRRRGERNLPRPLSPRDRVVALPAPSGLASVVPTPGSSLIGRDAEIAQLIAQLEDPATWLVTLTGPGGIGKTRLALAAAAAMQDRLPDGVIFIDLSAVTRAADAVPAMAQAIGLREMAGQDRASQIASFLRTRDLLLILDNLEQIAAAAPEIARIARQAETTILATSRAPLRVGGEREMPVPPLPLPGRDAAPDELLASDAGRLFAERAAARDPSFVVDEHSAPLIARICARLDGLPLAIELAAARANLLSPGQLHDRLEHTLPLLTRSGRDAPQRHLTMRDAIAWSYDLLAPAEQRLFRRLAIFAGGFTLDAAEWVGGRGVEGGGAGFGRSPDSRPPTSDPVLDHLEALLNQSMVVRETGSDGEPRFRMLETIRAFGLERLGSEEEAACRDAHARYFGEFAQTLRPMVVTESARAPLERLAAEDANLRAALTWLLNQESAAGFGVMAAALSGYWLAYSLLAEAASWLEPALASRERIPLPHRARLMVAAGIQSGFGGDVAQADLALAEGLRLSRATADPFDIAMALTSVGAARNQQGAYTAARARLEEARAVAATIADPRQRSAMMGRALANLAVAARGEGDFAAASALSETALETYRGFGFDLAETRVLMDLAGIAKDQGNLPPMVARYQTCLARTGERGDMRVVYEALAGIASACTAWGQSRSAVVLFSAAAALRERVGLDVSLPSDTTVTERSLAELQQTLSAAHFAAAWDEGRALPLSQALAAASAVTPEASKPKPPRAAAPFHLTRREREVLRLLAESRTDRDIAAALCIGPRTVSWHVGAILSKLGVATRREAALKAHTDDLL